MKKVLFVCHGNICRSPMAEFMFKDMAEKKGTIDMFEIASAATSREELGNPVYPPARRELLRHGIDASNKTARQLTLNDFSYYDEIVCMDDNNLRNIERMFGYEKRCKVKKLMSYCGEGNDVADPWYTGDFERTYNDIERGLIGLYEYFLSQKESFD